MLTRLILFSSVLALAGSLFAQANANAPGSADWSEPFPPHRMIGNIYYVGSRGLASYLITTPAGHILINSNLKTSVPLIRESIEKLGFRFNDVKILLISHAHYDHDGGSAEVKKLTGAKYMVMDGDVGVVESGGKSDFQYGDNATFLYPGTKVDRVLHNGDQVTLGDTVLTAHKTAGHTRGCTTWTLKVSEAGNSYDVVIVGSPNVNSGYKLVNNVRYPEIADDYARGFRVLKSLPCDVFLGAHGSYYEMEAKYARLNSGGANPYIDSAGYKNYICGPGTGVPFRVTETKSGSEKAVVSTPNDHNMGAIATSVLLGLTAAAANVFGGAIIVQRNWERRYLRYFVALGAGFMLATALVEMVPESLELRGRSAAFLVLLGYLIIHFFEHTVTPHFHFGEETHRDEFMHSQKGYSVLLGLVIHTFFDGIAIASGFLVSNWLGWLIFLAIFLHKIPEGFTVSSVMLASGRSRGTAWGASVVLGGSTLAGVLTMALFRHHVSAGLPLAAGVTIYVAASDLIPEVNKEPAMKMALLVFVGAGVFFLLDHLFRVH